MAGITPEVEDVHDYRITVGDKAADANPNLTDNYYNLEVAKRLLLRDWTPDNPEVGSYANGFVKDRIPSVEMAEVRRMKRVVNMHRRKLVHEASRGFSG